MKLLIIEDFVELAVKMKEALAVSYTHLENRSAVYFLHT